MIKKLHEIEKSWKIAVFVKAGIGQDYCFTVSCFKKLLMIFMQALSVAYEFRSEALIAYKSVGIKKTCIRCGSS